MIDLKGGFVETITPTLDEVCAYLKAENCRRVPVKRELYADCLTPIEAMRRIRAKSKHCFMLESAEPSKRWGRYTFLGFNPTLELTCQDGHMRVRRNVEDASLQIEERQVDNPADEIRTVLNNHKSAQLEGFPPFTGGLVGFFSYDYIKYSEPILRNCSAGNDTFDGDFLDVDLMLFDSLIVFDTYKQKIILITGVYTNAAFEDDKPFIEESYRKAKLRLDEMQNILLEGKPYDFKQLEMKSPLTPLFSKEKYMEMVESAKRHIREGDIFQVVLSNPQTAPASGSLFDAYRVMRCENPSPYMFYFTSDDVEIAGASPETLVRLRDGKLETFPLAGTRPRGQTQAEDEELERQLLQDEKELSEHNMLVDLGRNDLGKISKIGSVNVESYHKILRFSRVMHIGSTVEGQIADECDALDAINSVLPAGTLSGAPKIRACQIIQEQEGISRGIYGGAIGYLDLSGNMDTCIAIRLAYKRNDTVCVQSGAGIVADSDPATENQECINKARAVVEALDTAQGGLS